MAEQEKSATPASDAAEAAGNSQIDLEKVTAEQLEQLFETGSAELPTVSGEAGEPAAKAAPTEEKPPVKPAEETPPAKPAGEGEGEPTGEVEETRTPEEIAEAQTAARERVIAEGGDEAAQDAAAEEAGQPQPKAEDEPPAVQPKKEPEEDDEEELGSRPRLKDPVDRAIAAVYRARKGTASEISWAEAELLVKGDQTEAAPAPTVDLNKVVTDLETKLADVKAKLADAAKNEGVYDAALDKLNEERAELTADLKLAQRDLRQATEDAARADAVARQESEQTRTESRARAIEAFPDAADETTKLGAAVAKHITELRNPRHKNHSVIFADDAPYIVVRDVAEELGIQPVVKKKATAAKTPVTPPAKPLATPPKSKLSPASGAKTSVPVAQPQGDAKKELDRLLHDPNVSVEELDAVMEPGGPAKTLAAAVAA